MRTQYEAASIWIMWLLLGIYIAAGSYMIEDPRDEASIITRFAKSNGVMFCSAVTGVKMIELLRLKLFDPISRLMLVIVVYAFVYGVLSGPYMIVSFVQPLERNVLAHFFILFILVELSLYYLELKFKSKS